LWLGFTDQYAEYKVGDQIQKAKSEFEAIRPSSKLINYVYKAFNAREARQKEHSYALVEQKGTISSINP
jgi:hypothetical protein